MKLHGQLGLKGTPEFTVRNPLATTCRQHTAERWGRRQGYGTAVMEVRRIWSASQSDSDSTGKADGYSMRGLPRPFSARAGAMSAGPAYRHYLPTAHGLVAESETRVVGRIADHDDRRPVPGPCPFKSGFDQRRCDPLTPPVRRDGNRRQGERRGQYVQLTPANFSRHRPERLARPMTVRSPPSSLSRCRC